MYDMLSSAFTDTLKREGKTIYSFTGNTPYTVIFRRNSDKNKIQSKLSIFYPAGCGIHAGQLLTYKDQYFLTINQESTENNVYNRSDLFQTNATMNFIQGSKEVIMPVYSYNFNDALGHDNQYIAVISGAVLILCEHNPITNKLKLDDNFYAMAHYLRVVNSIYKDNLIYLYAQIDTIPSGGDVYSVSIVADSTYNKGETVQLQAIAKTGDTVITNAKFEWYSSNPDVATVDNNGLVHFLTDGTFDITATWTDFTVSDTKTIEVVEPVVYSLQINGENTYTTGDKPKLTATAQEDGVTVSDATITWDSSDTSVATIDSTGQVTFLTAGEVIFTAVWVEHDITATLAVTVTEAVGITCTISYLGASTIKVSAGKTLTAHFWDGAVEITDQTTEEWTVVKPAGFEDEITSTEDPDANTIRIQVENDFDLIGKHITLTLQDSNHTCSSSLDIEIVSLL